MARVVGRVVSEVGGGGGELNAEMEKPQTVRRAVVAPRKPYRPTGLRAGENAVPDITGKVECAGQGGQQDGAPGVAAQPAAHGRLGSAAAAAAARGLDAEPPAFAMDCTELTLTKTIELQLYVLSASDAHVQALVDKLSAQVGKVEEEFLTCPCNRVNELRQAHRSLRTRLASVEAARAAREDMQSDAPRPEGEKKEVCPESSSGTANTTMGPEKEHGPTMPSEASMLFRVQTRDRSADGIPSDSDGTQGKAGRRRKRTGSRGSTSCKSSRVTSDSCSSDSASESEHGASGKPHSNAIHARNSHGSLQGSDEVALKDEVAQESSRIFSFLSRFW